MGRDLAMTGVLPAGTSRRRRTVPRTKESTTGKSTTGEFHDGGGAGEP